MIDTEIDNLEIHSPLETRNEIKYKGLNIKEIPLQGKITLRGGDNISGLNSIPSLPFMKAVKKSLQIDLPISPLTSTSAIDKDKDILQVFCISFDEWLILCNLSKVESIMNSLKGELSDLHHALVDVSDYYISLDLNGEWVEDLLSYGITLDLNLASFPIGKGSYTDWHHANIFLIRQAKLQFQIIIRWSMAQYLYSYLEESAQELNEIYHNPE